MASPKQSRTTAARAGGGKSRDKGTKGGRPEPMPAGTAGRGNGQRPSGQPRGQASRTADRPPAGRTPAAPLGPGVRAVPLWLQLTTWVLALAGLGVSIYLTVAHFTGLAFYVFMAAATSPWAWRATWPAIRWARFGSVVVGMVFVLYLLYTELFTLNAICLFCTIVHVITFLLFGLIVFSFAAGYGTTETSPRR